MSSSLGWISLIVAAISLVGNVYQHIKYSNKIERLTGGLSAWWHWQSSMRRTIDKYSEMVSQDISPDQFKGLVCGTINSIYENMASLGDDIGKTLRAIASIVPWHDKPWEPSTKDSSN